jgi:hypothetical protein
MSYNNSFLELKQLTENIWTNKKLENIYGFQFQPESKWKDGLSKNEIIEFEKIIGFEFPEIIRDYYSVMNGIDKETVNVFGDSGIPYIYTKTLYAYPEDLELINNLTQQIYNENNMDRTAMSYNHISRIFPVYGHCFMLIDHPYHPIFSMNGKEIVYLSNDLADFFYKILAHRGEILKLKLMKYGWAI